MDKSMHEALRRHRMAKMAMAEQEDPKDEMAETLPDAGEGEEIPKNRYDVVDEKDEDKIPSLKDEEGKEGELDIKELLGEGAHGSLRKAAMGYHDDRGEKPEVMMAEEKEEMRPRKKGHFKPLIDHKA